jgi:hypothetical protein
MVATGTASRIDYDSDIVKHYVRLNGWLPAIQHRARRVGRRHLRYLTFCAANAIDVFTFELEGILHRDPKTQRLDGVYFCEMNPDAFNEISTLVGSSEFGFLGKFEEIMLFEDTRETEGLSLDDIAPTARDHKLREALSIKSAHQRLSESFPFDVINLDMSGAIFPPYEPPASQMFRAMRRVLELQKETSPNGRGLSEFTLFTTTRVAAEEMHPEAIGELQGLVTGNVRRHQSIREVFQEKYGNKEVEEVKNDEFANFFAIGYSKLLLHEAMLRHWDMEYRNVFLYARSRETERLYHIVSTVAHLRRLSAPDNALVGGRGSFPEWLLDRYVDEATETLRFTPHYVESKALNEETTEGLLEHLRNVVGYRETFRQGLGRE